MIVLARALVVGFVSFIVQGVAYVNAEDNDGKVETLAEVAIIGNSELPSISFDLPWRLPSVQKREEQSPPKEIPGVVMPIEPRRYKQQLHFSRFLEVDAPHFQAR